MDRLSIHKRHNDPNPHLDSLVACLEKFHRIVNQGARRFIYGGRTVSSLPYNIWTPTTKRVNKWAWTLSRSSANRRLRRIYRGAALPLCGCLFQASGKSTRAHLCGALIWGRGARNATRHGVILNTDLDAESTSYSHLLSCQL